MSSKLKYCKSHQKFYSKINSLCTICSQSFNTGNSCSICLWHLECMFIFLPVLLNSQEITYDPSRPSPEPLTPNGSCEIYAIRHLFLRPHFINWEGVYWISEILDQKINIFKFLFRGWKVQLYSFASCLFTMPGSPVLNATRICTAVSKHIPRHN